MATPVENVILITAMPVDEGELLKSLQDEHNLCGAVVSFSGRVRQEEQGDAIEALFLEHYPQMTQNSIATMVEKARQRWALHKVTIIHRIGKLLPGELIVFVGVSSSHRDIAFAACEFLMDYLKTAAPLWKKAIYPQPNKAHWVEAKTSDTTAMKRWQNKP